VLKRPSARRRSREEVQLNLVPLLDTMVTMIAFLLFTMSFLSIVSIESPFPVASSETTQKKLTERPLQLTVSLREGDTEIWSPFGKIENKTIPHLSEGQPDLKVIHETLHAIKQKFPAEKQVVFAPAASVNYDVMIAVMDAMRTLEPGDAPIFVKNEATGNDEALKVLFPDVIFGNLLGSS
jgi:biopolymer transport protein ExbD